MNDLSAILETVLLLAIPFVPVAFGALLRRRFKPGAEAQTGAQRFGRLAGNILLWAGIAGILFTIIVVLNFKGKL